MYSDEQRATVRPRDSHYRLLDPDREQEFSRRLEEILTAVKQIEGLGVSGFMKMPYKDTRLFTHIERVPERYYPRNPRLAHDNELDSPAEGPR